MITYYGEHPKIINDFSPLTENDINIDTLLGSEHPIEQNMIRYVDETQTSRMPRNVIEIYENLDKSIIVERMEDYSQAFKQHTSALATRVGWEGPITVHLFVSPASAKSFPFHTDVENVVIYCLSGCKTMEIRHSDGNIQPVEIHAGQALYLPQGTFHRATNHHCAMTLSYGFEYFIEDIIRQRNRAVVDA